MMLKLYSSKLKRLTACGLMPLWIFVALPIQTKGSDKEPKKILALQQQAENGDAKSKSPANGSPAKAASNANPLGNSAAKTASERPVTENLSSEAEASILEFAKREQLQLFELLQYLKQKRPTSYQQALKETGRNKQRLESLKEKDPELYEIESQLWRIRSKLSFLAAQLSVQDDTELDKQLETLVRELETQEVSRLTLMRDRAAKQLEKWESQLQDRQAEFASSVDKSVENWKSRIKKQRSSPKKPS